MKKHETIAQRALRLFAPIPDDNVIINEFTDGVDKCCIVGHWVRLNSNNPNDYSKSNCNDELESDLREVTEEFLHKKHGVSYNIATVNNGPNMYVGSTHKLFKLYPQTTPKARSMALLQDMVAAGY